MGKYELTVHKNYVPEWGVVEAVRELFQNALDQEIVEPSNTMFFSYDEDKEILEIGNKESTLEASSLLLGNTTKLNSSATIGQFGEGYKLAMLILVRNNIGLTFYNYGKREIWKPRFVNSRRYASEILTVFTEKIIWSKPPENSLIIRMEGITLNMYEEICESNLHLSGAEQCKTSKKYGKLLEDENMKGKIFVNGLYVTTKTDLKYGYDFLPSVLKLKRDRSMVDSFDLKNVMAKLWNDLEDSDKSEIAKMIVNDVSDVSYIRYDTSLKRRVSEDVYNTFKEQHGENAVAISSDVDIETFVDEHPNAKPVVVSDSMLDVIVEDNRYTDDIESYYVELDRTLYEKLDVWFKKLRADTYIDSNISDEFYELIEDIKQ